MKKLNVVMILADDMGYGDFGKFSEGRAHTPTLDFMVNEGVCFTQQYAESPVCTPARAALLTGRYHHRTGAIDMREHRGLSSLSLRETTIADVFKQNGYATGLVGKWHNGTIGLGYHPNARGFDEFVGFRGGQSDYYDWCLYYNDLIRRSDGRYLTDVFTDESVSFVERHSHEPFFLHVAYNAPHSPLQAPEEDVRRFMYKGDFSKGVSTLYAMIYHMDKGIERIFDTLRRLGIEENTLVLFASDNGPDFSGEGDMCAKRFNSGLAGSKFYVYEGGIRVPAVLRWPGGLKSGVQENCFVHATDWFPTLLAAAGIDVPGLLKLDGINIMPTLTGNGDLPPSKRFWQWNRYYPERECNAAMRDGNWKLVCPPLEDALKVLKADYDIDRRVEQNPEAFTETSNPPLPERILPLPKTPQLFDIENDPCESEDIAGQHPQRVDKMLAELNCWFDEVEAERKSIQE